MAKKSKWQTFKERWQDGCGSNLCAGATKICLARGKIPCDVLFCGEAPGISEDVIGSPFVGQAGKLLDHIVSQAVPPDVRCSFTNLVGCIPRGNNGKKFEEPDKDQILQCADRLTEYLELCDPKLVITVGALAKKWVPTKDFDWASANIVHPAAILRMSVAAQPLEIKRCVVTLADSLTNACIP